MCRHLENPDGRALYAYQCTREEFETLIGVLEQTAPTGGQVGQTVTQAFVLYASEWDQ